MRYILKDTQCSTNNFEYYFKYYVEILENLEQG